MRLQSSAAAGRDQDAVLERALRYAARGWPVLPIHRADADGCDCGRGDCESPGKHPRTPHGLSDASTDEATIRAWWRRWPTASVGIRTGASAGLVVLDVDGDDGAEALRALEAEHGELPRTASVATRSGGQHFYFCHPGGEVRNSARRLGPGLDVRGDGGYVVAPPSPGYVPDEEAPIAPLPAWLLALIRAGGERRNGNAPAADGEPIPEGRRNDTLASFAGAMRRRGMDAPEIAAALSTANRRRCRPPLDEPEVERIAASIARYEPDSPAPAPSSAADHRQAPGDDEPAPTAYSFAKFVDFAAIEYPEAEPLLGEPGHLIIAKGTLLLSYGPEGSGKTTWAIDGAAHLAAGIEWLGLAVPRPVRILLIEVEGPPGLFRAKLASKRDTWRGPAFAENVHVYAQPWGEFSFATADARAALTAYCDEHAIDLVIANPTLGLGVAASGRPDETQQFVNWLRECGLGRGRAFWLIHHRNKTGQVSGDWGRHPDTVVQLQPDGNRRATRLTWEKTRWASIDPARRSAILEWETETEGYTVVELDGPGASDSELVERLSAYLEAHPASPTRDVLRSVEGTQSRLRALLEERPEFDCTEGPRRAKLWFTASTVSEGKAGR